MADLFGNTIPRPKWNTNLQNQLIETVAVKIFTVFDKKHNITDIKSELHDFLLQYDLAFTESQFKKTFETKFNSIFDYDFQTLFNYILSVKEKLLETEIRWWVLQNHIKPKYEIETKVLYNDKVMTICDINSKMGTYLLSIYRDLYVANYESVEPINS